MFWKRTTLVIFLILLFEISQLKLLTDGRRAPFQKRLKKIFGQLKFSFFPIDRERMDGIFKLFVSRGKGWRF